MFHQIFSSWLVAAVVFAGLAQPAHAADPFFKGKTVTLLVSTAPGGAYDLIARLFAKQLPNHLEGAPTVIVQNMPGGGGKTLSNHLYNIAPKDGTSIAILNQTLGIDQIVSDDVQYSTAKFEWLGRVATTTGLVIVHKNAPAATLEEMKTKEVLFAGQGKGSQTYMIPMMMKTLLGLKTKVILGYQSAPEIFKAMESGEVHGRTGDVAAVLSSHPDWLKDGTIRILGELTLADKPSMPNLPLLTKMAPNPQALEVLELVGSYTAFGFPFAAPPGTARDRVEVLRKALDGVVKDPAFLADMDKAKLVADHMSGADIQKIADKFSTVTPEVVERTKKALEW